MADKVLKSRIKLLYKSISDWELVKDSFIPLQGELCLAVNGETNAVLAKVGNGVSNFGALPWMQAVASDVRDWAKKDSLDFADLDEDFKAALSSYVGAGNEYRINKSGEVYALQVRQYDAAVGAWGEWANVEGSSIDLSNKTDRVLNGANGKALIFNESDGGGAKFEHNDGTNSFVGVNDGGASGIAGQIYAVNKSTNVGARINITANGMFYTNGKNTYTYGSTDELATKGDIADAVNNLGSALHYLGMTEAAAGETVGHALERIVSDYQSRHLGYTLKEGAVAIVDSVEFIYNGSAWQEFGDEGLYETRADAAAAHAEL